MALASSLALAWVDCIVRPYREIFIAALAVVPICVGVRNLTSVRL